MVQLVLEVCCPSNAPRPHTPCFMPGAWGQLHFPINLHAVAQGRRVLGAQDTSVPLSWH